MPYKGEKHREYNREWAKKNAHKKKEYDKIYKEVNKEKIKAQTKEYREQNKEKLRNGRLKAVYGITIEQYNEMFEKQGGVCAICLKPETHTIKGIIVKLAVDHDHETGKVRGLLCNLCNTAIGHLQNSPELCRMAGKYLEGSANTLG